MSKSSAINQMLTNDYCSIINPSTVEPPSLSSIKFLENKSFMRKVYLNAQYSVTPFLILMAREQNIAVTLPIDLSIFSDVSVSFASDYIFNLQDYIPRGEILFVPIGIKLIGMEGTFYHLTSLLIRTKDKTMTYYDSNGSLEIDPIEEFLKEKLSPIFLDYQFIPSSQICPSIGPQGFVDKGYCAAYSLFFFWALIKDPHISPEMLILEIIKLPIDNQFQMIENFICYVYTIIKNYHLDLIQSYYKYAIRIIEDRRDYPQLKEIVDKLYYNLDEENLVRFFRKYCIEEQQYDPETPYRTRISNYIKNWLYNKGDFVESLQ